jgi:hypothetical protein
MKRKVLLVLATILVLVVGGLAWSQAAKADSPTPANQLIVKIKISDTGNVFVGGLDLGKLGVQPVNPQGLQVVKNLENAHLVLSGEAVTADVQGTPVVSVQWNAASRKTLESLAKDYGVQVTDAVQVRVEQWVASSKIDVTAQYSNEPGEMAKIDLSTPIQIDIDPNGAVAIEGIPINVNIQSGVMQTIMVAGRQATICWKQTSLTTAVDGQDLPTITVNPAGVAILDKALGLNLDQGVRDQIFNSRVGVDVAVPGGTHRADITCSGD